MKRILLLLLTVPFIVCASDYDDNAALLARKQEEERIEKIQKAFSNATNCANVCNVVLQKVNLTNYEFSTLTRIVPKAESLDVSHNKINYFNADIQLCTSFTSLDLSNNAFTGSFPISFILSRFPKLETLKINNNKISCFDFKGDDNYLKKHDNSLKVVEARNTDFIAMDLKYFMMCTPLQVLDLSESQKLSHLYSSDFGHITRVPLKVILKDTKHDFSTQSGIKKYTSTACVVLILSAAVGASVGWFLGGSEATAATGGACGLGVGFPLIHCLPSEGKRVVVEFVTK